MQVLRVVLAAHLAFWMVFQQVNAQPLTLVDGPAEIPPAGFRGTQYVDSKGCVFVRAGVNGQITWIPRVDRNRRLVCGFKPSIQSQIVTPSEPPVKETPPTPAVGQPEPVTNSAKATAAVGHSATPNTTRKKVPTATKLVYAKPVRASKTLCPQPPDTAQRYLLSDGRRVTRCSLANGDPVEYLNGLGAPNLVVANTPPGKKQIKNAMAADAGKYRVVWSKGKLATHNRNDKVVATSVAGSSHKMGKAQPRYVQVGVFAEPANADRAISTLKAHGLRVSTAQGKRGIKPLRMILAGPFSTAEELARALQLARQSGYRDAFVRH